MVVEYQALIDGEVRLDGRKLYGYDRFNPAALQAAVVGVAAGFVLHMLLSLVVVQGKELWSKPAAPAACKKSRDAGTPSGRQAAPVMRRPT